MGISRRKLITGTGLGAGVVAAGAGASLLTDNLPTAPDSLLKIDVLQTIQRQAVSYQSEARA